MKIERTMWAVAYVWRGVADSVKLFADEAGAWKHVRDLRETMPHEDEVDVFEVAVPRDLTVAAC